MWLYLQKNIARKKGEKKVGIRYSAGANAVRRRRPWNGRILASSFLKLLLQNQRRAYFLSLEVTERQWVDLAREDEKTRVERRGQESEGGEKRERNTSYLPLTELGRRSTSSLRLAFEENMKV
ncbi:hypothetical protein HAX54_053329 [Datura stramonium]|uniref:Uncharacterized protein n=1 Tax=Datura stramonium TaxID=4076 RepID=A0ABS8WT99_DATST|nr:hypothetical protein [Datura stramonium]